MTKLNVGKVWGTKLSVGRVSDKVERRESVRQS